MTKNTHIPYGATADEFNAEDDPWTKLASLAEHLEDQPLIKDASHPEGGSYAIPPDLARWLGNAIKYANEDKDELLRRLGLSKSKGAPYPNVLGRRVCELEWQGYKREAALAKVMAESDNGEDEKLSRSKLQRLRDEYLAAQKSAVEIWIEDE